MSLSDCNCIFFYPLPQFALFFSFNFFEMNISVVFFFLLNAVLRRALVNNQNSYFRKLFIIRTQFFNINEMRFVSPSTLGLYFSC